MPVARVLRIVHATAPRQVVDALRLGGQQRVSHPDHEVVALHRGHEARVVAPGGGETVLHVLHAALERVAPGAVADAAAAPAGLVEQAEHRRRHVVVAFVLAAERRPVGLHLRQLLGRGARALGAHVVDIVLEVVHAVLADHRRQARVVEDVLLAHRVELRRHALEPRERLVAHVALHVVQHDLRVPRAHSPRARAPAGADDPPQIHVPLRVLRIHARRLRLLEHERHVPQILPYLVLRAAIHLQLGDLEPLHGLAERRRGRVVVRLRDPPRLEARFQLGELTLLRPRDVHEDRTVHVVEVVDKTVLRPFQPAADRLPHLVGQTARGLLGARGAPRLDLRIDALGAALAQGRPADGVEGVEQLVVAADGVHELAVQAGCALGHRVRRLEERAERAREHLAGVARLERRAFRTAARLRPGIDPVPVEPIQQALRLLQEVGRLLGRAVALEAAHDALRQRADIPQVAARLGRKRQHEVRHLAHRDAHEAPVAAARLALQALLAQLLEPRVERRLAVGAVRRHRRRVGRRRPEIVVALEESHGLQVFADALLVALVDHADGVLVRLGLLHRAAQEFYKAHALGGRKRERLGDVGVARGRVPFGDALVHGVFLPAATLLAGGEPAVRLLCGAARGLAEGEGLAPVARLVPAARKAQVAALHVPGGRAFKRHGAACDLPLAELRHRESSSRIVDVHARVDETHLSRLRVDEGVAARLEVIDHELAVVGDLARRRHEVRAGIVAVRRVELVRALPIPRLVVDPETLLRLVQRLEYLPLARRDDVPCRIRLRRHERLLEDQVELVVPVVVPDGDILQRVGVFRKQVVVIDDLGQRLLHAVQAVCRQLANLDHRLAACGIDSTLGSLV